MIDDFKECSKADDNGDLCVREFGHVGRCTNDIVEAEEKDQRNALIDSLARIPGDVQRNAHDLDGAALAELIADHIRERRT